MNGKLRLAVDADSGDFGADVMVRGVVAARQESETAFETYLCGDGARVERVLDEALAEAERGGKPVDKNDFIIEHCGETINDDDKKSTVWKKKSGASIVRCVTLQKEGAVCATVSAGDTGVLMGSALFILGRKKGVSRPALGAFVPTPKKPVLVLDVGANISCRAEHLVSFADLGIDYTSRLFGRDDVTVGLLNVGTEPTKGPKEVREAAEMLSGNKNYIGFIEGNKIFYGEADIVVCDGFIGNALLKACESFYGLIKKILTDEQDISGQASQSNIMIEKNGINSAAVMTDRDGNNLGQGGQGGQLGQGGQSSIMQKIKNLNSENYGAVPFLGIDGTVLKAHGGSSARSIKSSILTALRVVD